VNKTKPRAKKPVKAPTDRLTGIEESLAWTTLRISKLLAMGDTLKNLEGQVLLLYQLRERQNQQMGEIVKLMRSVLKPMRVHPVAGEIVAAAEQMIEALDNPEGANKQIVAFRRLKIALAAVPVVQ
jgi:hypothetical protein